MKPLSIAGLVLIALGLVALFSQGIPYTSRETIIDIGPIQATADQEKTFSLPPVLGILAVVGGAALLLTDARRKRSA